MKTDRLATCLLGAGVLLGLGVDAMPAQSAPTEIESAAVDAYVYGYPLVTMELTRRSFTNVAKPDGKSAPMGYFANVPKYPPASDKRVTAPNANTLYSTAWIDVGKEPYILHVPDEHGRYSRPENGTGSVDERDPSGAAYEVISPRVGHSWDNMPH